MTFVPFLHLAHREGNLSRAMPDGNVVRPAKGRVLYIAAALRVAVLWLGLGLGLGDLAAPTTLVAELFALRPGPWTTSRTSPTFSPSSMATTASAAAFTGDTVKDNYIPLFSNRPSDYKEWRKRVKLYHRKLELQKRGKEATINLLTSLMGVSWRQVEHLVDKIADEEDGFDQVLLQLDKCFKYDDRVEMPRAMERFFYGSTRRGDQSLMQYCADHREARRELEKHKISLPDSVSGWLMLRRSSLTYEQRQMVQTQCTSLEENKVEEAMYYLFGQDFRGRSDVRWGANAQAAKIHQRWPRRQQAYVAEDAYEMDENDIPDEDYQTAYADEDDAYYDEMLDADDDAYWESYGADDNKDETYYQDDAGTEDYDGAMEEAYAAYLDARRQFANLRAARGYYPVVALAPETPGGAPSQRPVSPGGKGKFKGKGKRKGSAPKGKGRNSNPPQKGSVASRTAAYFGGSATCFVCGKAGHLAAQCPNGSPTSKGTSSPPSPSKRPKTADAMMVTDEALHADDGVPHLGPKGWYGIQDGGASSMVIGHNS